MLVLLVVGDAGGDRVHPGRAEQAYAERFDQLDPAQPALLHGDRARGEQSAPHPQGAAGLALQPVVPPHLDPQAERPTTPAATAASSSTTIIIEDGGVREALTHPVDDLALRPEPLADLHHTAGRRAAEQRGDEGHRRVADPRQVDGRELPFAVFAGCGGGGAAEEFPAQPLALRLGDGVELQRRLTAGVLAGADAHLHQVEDPQQGVGRQVDAADPFRASERRLTSSTPVRSSARSVPIR